MAGAMRKMAVYLGLVEEDLDDYEPENEPRPRPYQPVAADSRTRPATEPSPRSVTTAVAERPVPQRPSVDRPVIDRSVIDRGVADRGLAERPVVERPTVERPVAVTGARAEATATPKASGGTGSDLNRINTLHPRSYNDARRVGEDFREGVPVIINLTGMDDSDAKRIVDFAAGLVFGLRGTIERVTNKVFLLSPANVDVGAEARAQIAQDGFYNQS